MNIATRLEHAVLAVLAAGCVPLGLKEPELDDEACFAVEGSAAQCPSAEEAADRLVGSRTCESPVREVTATGELLYSEDGIPTGYGGYDTPSTGDTGDVMTRCCYEAAYKDHEGQSCTIGRPMVSDDGEVVVAPVVARDDWGSAACDNAPDLEAAAWWSRQAQLEHASVAAFAALVNELLKLGAPADLVARAAAALQDEVAHAEACFRLASRFGGSPVGPGPLAVPAPREVSLLRLAVDAYREGCVGETASVLVAAAQLAHATDPDVRETVSRVLADESRHAALSWDVVAWAVAQGGEAVRDAVAEVASHVSIPAGLTVREEAAGRGVPDRAATIGALRRAVRDVIEPARAELLAA